MAVSIVALCVTILALVYVPGFRPSAEVLECDRKGGFWSSDLQACQLTDSPLAGLAS